MTSASAGQASYRLRHTPARTGSPSAHAHEAAVGWESHRSCSGARSVTEVRVGRPDGPREAGEFVGERDGGFVVAPAVFELQGPGLQAAGRARRFLGVTEDGAGAVDQQHAKVRIAALANRPEMAARAARMLAWGEAEIAREVAARGEAPRVSDAGDERGRREEANAGNGPQLSDERQGGGEGLELAVDDPDARLELVKFGDDHVQGGAQRRGHRTVGGANRRRDPVYAPNGPERRPAAGSWPRR
jgi:hypothetical protein